MEIADSKRLLRNDAPAVSRLLECPCTPQRKIEANTGTIDGKAADPPIHFSKQLDATSNLSCHLSTYKGGRRCNEHYMFLIDTDKECKSSDCSEKVVDEVYMKFTFYYEDARHTANGDRRNNEKNKNNEKNEEEGVENGDMEKKEKKKAHDDEKSKGNRMNRTRTAEEA